MSSWKRRVKAVAPVLLLALIYLGALLSVPGYCENLRFVFIADSRSTGECGTINTAALDDLIDQILKAKPAFVIFGGDIAIWGVNADGSNNFVPFKARMRKLTDQGIKLYMALGNHELYKQKENGERKHQGKFFLVGQQQYQQVFPGPAGTDKGPPGYEGLVYAFKSPGGDAFFVVLDPFYLDEAKGGYKQDQGGHDGIIDAVQRNWLAGEIKKNSTIKHKILIMHTPAFTVQAHESPQFYNELWKQLVDSRFDLVLCGHEHLYSRKFIDSIGDKHWEHEVVQLINGGAGAPAYADKKPCRDPKDWHIDIDGGKHYYTVVDIKGDKVEVNTYKGSLGIYSPDAMDHFTIPDSGKAERPGK